MTKPLLTDMAHDLARGMDVSVNDAAHTLSRALTTPIRPLGVKKPRVYREHSGTWILKFGDRTYLTNTAQAAWRLTADLYQRIEGDAG